MRPQSKRHRDKPDPDARRLGLRVRGFRDELHISFDAFVEELEAALESAVPVRALNQVTYCPRLYYLQYVDAVMPTNEHVESGLFDHRRVNAPDPRCKHQTAA